MPAGELPSRPNLEQYRKQAKHLLKQWKAADALTTRTLADAQHALARDHGFDTWKAFTDEIAGRAGQPDRDTIWKAAEAALISGDEVALGRLLSEHEQMFRADDYWKGDARAIITRNHFFETWDQFADFTRQAKDTSSSVARFERAADAVVSGDVAVLERALADHPELVRARSARMHHSTLLHYVGANGIEGWRQRTPKNAVRVAEILLDAGSEVDAPADMYGGGSTTLGLVATSCHPRDAGLQQPLIDLLLERGAQVDLRGAGGGASAGHMINGCLANGRPEAAEHLAQRGAPIDLEGAAGIGRLDLVKSFFNPDGTLKPPATIAQIKDGFTWACEYGRTDVVEYLLDHGVSAGEVLPNPHKQTGVHWAAFGGHVETVKALLKRRPPLDVRDASFNATPLGWAIEGWGERREHDPARREPYYEVVRLLVAAGAPVEEDWQSDELAAADPRMAAALRGRP